MSPEHPSIDGRSRVDCLQHLFATTPVAAWSAIGGGAAAFLWLFPGTSPGLLVGWFGTLCLWSACRLIYKRVFDRYFEPVHARRWETGYQAVMGATGLTWGALAWQRDPPHEYEVLFLLTVILLVSSITLVASRRTFLTFTAGVLIPLSLSHAFSPAQGGPFLVFSTVAVCIVAMIAHRVHFHFLVSAFESRHRTRDLLQQQRVIFEAAGEGIVFIKPKPAYTAQCNARFAEILGYPVHAVAGMKPWQWHPDRVQWKEMVKAAAPVIAAGRRYQQVLRLRRADGSLFWAETTGMAADPSDVTGGTVWVVSDISAKRATEAALRLSEQRFRDLVKISSDIYWEQDSQFCFTKFDGQDEVLKRLPLDGFLGKERWDLGAPTPDAEWRAHREALERREPFRDLVYPLTTRDGEKCWLSISGNPLFDENGNFTGYHGVATDITARIRSEESFRHLAFHDALTQLPNRRLLCDRLEHAIAAASRAYSRVGLLLLDLNGFKYINDTFGHAAGDHILQVVAQRLGSAVRESDTVARLGGDEFVVVLSDVVDREAAAAVAEKIRQIVSLPAVFEAKQLQVGCSVGIAIFPEDGHNSEELMSQADAAMYVGKPVRQERREAAVLG